MRLCLPGITKAGLHSIQHRIFGHIHVTKLWLEMQHRCQHSERKRTDTVCTVSGIRRRKLDVTPRCRTNVDYCNLGVAVDIRSGAQNTPIVLSKGKVAVKSAASSSSVTGMHGTTRAGLHFASRNGHLMRAFRRFQRQARNFSLSSSSKFWNGKAAIVRLLI